MAGLVKALTAIGVGLARWCLALATSAACAQAAAPSPASPSPASPSPASPSPASPSPVSPQAVVPGAAAAYVFDRTHTFVHFEVLHFDTATIRGRLGPLDGQAELDTRARRGRVQLAIDLAQISTGLPVLDALLRRADLLDVDTHPQAFFVGDQFEFDEQGRVRTVSGEFTLRGTGRPLRLQAQRWRCYFNPLFRREVCGGDFVAEFKRSDYGITHSLPFVADTVRLLVQVEAIRQAGP